jgi:putative ABC transport system substrate-binding protein
MTSTSAHLSVGSKEAGSKKICGELFVWLLVAILSVTVSLAEAQQAKKLHRVGFLVPGTASSVSARREAFLQGLRELGYVERQNILIDYRYAEGKSDQLADLAAELVNSEVDVIVAQNYTTATALSEATKTIPIVVAHGYDPVAAGLAQSYARPGGNVTGLGNLTNDLGGKRLELLKETVPRVTRIAVLPSPGVRRLEMDEIKEMQDAAPSLQVRLQFLNVRVASDLEPAFESATKAHAGALAVTSDWTGILIANRKRIAELALKNRLPSIYPSNEYTEAGGLMFYGPDVYEMYRRVAYYVDKILKGAKPADLPVEQPKKVEFVINLKTAKALNLTIPQSLLYRADRVIPTQ